MNKTNAKLKDLTLKGSEQKTQGDGWGEFSAPPRGYAVYAPLGK